MVCALNHDVKPPEKNETRFEPISQNSGHDLLSQNKQVRRLILKKLPDYHDNLFFIIISLKYTCHQITIYKEPNNSNEAPLQIFSFAKIKCTI